MTSAQMLGLGINVSMALMVFGVALSADFADIRSAFRNPGLLVRSLIAMYVVMPLIAIVIALNFELSHQLKVALILLALSPVPPVLPKKQIKAGGSQSYVLGLLVVASLVAIVVVPAGIAIIGQVIGQDLEVPFGVTTRVVAISVLMPVIAGLVAARLVPRFAAKAAGPIGIAAIVLLLISFLPVLVVARHAVFAQVGHFTVLAIVLFALIGIAAGHLLGGPIAGDRTVLALAVATRHPGVALAVLDVLGQADKGVAPVVILYLIVSALAAAPYLAWRKRVKAAAGSG